MPFGAYKKQRLVDLPQSYLEWLLSLPDLREPLRSALWKEGERRIRALNRALGRSQGRPAEDVPRTLNQDTSQNDVQDAVEQVATDGEPHEDG